MSSSLAPASPAAWWHVFTKYKLDILLIEKEVDVGMGTSSANSAAVHAGYKALPGTNKAITNAIAMEFVTALQDRNNLHQWASVHLGHAPTHTPPLLPIQITTLHLRGTG